MNFYKKTFGTNEIFSITRDFIVIFAVIIFGLIIVYQIFIRDFFILMFSLFKVLKIKDKTEHDLDGAESVIMNRSSRTDATKEKKKTESQSPDS